jgi:CRP-like cAMP-binding protein
MDPAITSEESANELYARLSPELVDLLRECECPALLKAGMPLISHGQDPDHLVIVRSGEVRLSLPSRGNSVVLGTAGAGKVLGLRCLISGELPEIDALCVRDCRVATISRSEFMDVLKKHPEIYFAIVTVLSSDLELAEQCLKSVSRPLRGHSLRPGNC